jgi:hypothetical protein
MPGQKLVQILPSGAATSGGFDVSRNGQLASGLRWRADMKSPTVLLLKEMEGTTRVEQVTIPAYVTKTAVADDARAVACFGPGGLWVYERERRTISRVGPRAWYPGDCAWLPDSRRLVVGNGSHLYLVDTHTAQVRPLLELSQSF